MLHVLMLPDSDRADRIGEFWGYPESGAFAELFIDCEEDRTLRAVLGRDAPRVGRLTQEGRQTDRIPSHMDNRSREPGRGEQETG